MSDNITAADLRAYRRDLANCPASECCTGDCNQGRICPIAMARLTARGAVAWRGVDPQALREGRRTPAEGCTELGAYYDDGAGWPRPAEACTDIGADSTGQHRESWITRAWLRFARALG